MDAITFALSKKYTEESLDGVGALKGKNCTIQSVVDNPDGTHTVTFKWTSDSGVVSTSVLTVKDGDMSKVNVGGGLSYDDETKTLNGNQYSTIPTPANIFLNKVIQYVGAGEGDYHSGYFYKCVNDGGTLKWAEIQMPGETNALTNLQVQAILDILN